MRISSRISRVLFFLERGLYVGIDFVGLAFCWAPCIHSAEEGKLFETTLRSRVLRNTHDMWVYTPPGYSEKEGPYPLLIVFDGAGLYERSFDSRSKNFR